MTQIINEPEINLNANCITCSHQKPCGILSTVLKAVMLSKDKNSFAEVLGAGYAYTYAQICELYDMKDPTANEQVF